MSARNPAQTILRHHAASASTAARFLASMEAGHRFRYGNVAEQPRGATLTRSHGALSAFERSGTSGFRRRAPMLVKIESDQVGVYGGGLVAIGGYGIEIPRIFARRRCSIERLKEDASIRTSGHRNTGHH